VVKKTRNVSAARWKKEGYTHSIQGIKKVLTRDEHGGLRVGAAPGAHVLVKGGHLGATPFEHRESKTSDATIRSNKAASKDRRARRIAKEAKIGQRRHIEHLKKKAVKASHAVHSHLVRKKTGGGLMRWVNPMNWRKAA
jgi:hypothetical protein